jgi:hypothetical protein
MITKQSILEQIVFSPQFKNKFTNADRDKTKNIISLIYNKKYPNKSPGSYVYCNIS